MKHQLSTSRAAFLLFVIVIAWGLNWPVTKLIVEVVPPVWTTAIRCWIAFIALVVVMKMGGNLITPSRQDIPVVLSISLLHMVAFSTLVAASLQFIPASKAIVLGYTTPLWVALAAPVFLKEKIGRWKIAGVIMGMIGLAIIFTPQSLDWSDHDVMFGSALTLLAAAFWAASIIYVRSHQWVATPFQLLLWQVLIAAIVLTLTGLATEGVPVIDWSIKLGMLMLYGGLVGTALAYWAMSLVNRSLPAISTSLGVMATPPVGIISAALILDESIDVSLIVATFLIVGGIGVSTLAEMRIKHKRNATRI